MFLYVYVHSHREPPRKQGVPRKPLQASVKPHSFEYTPFPLHDDRPNYYDDSNYHDDSKDITCPLGRSCFFIGRGLQLLRFQFFETYFSDTIFFVFNSD